MTVDERIGANVHQLLWLRGLKQRELYEEMGVSRESLAKKMRGQISWLARDIDAAARVLNVEPGRLFDRTQVTGEKRRTVINRHWLRLAV